MTPANATAAAAAAGLGRRLCRFVLLLFRVKVETRGALPREPALLVANHFGWLDIVAVLAYHDCGFVAKKEVRAWPIVGPLVERLGGVFVDRSRKRDLLYSIPQLARRLREGRRVLVFAEGTTSDGSALLPFKSALLEAAVRANVPVVPLAIKAHAESGDLSALAWIGDETLMANIPRVRALRGIGFTIHAAPGLDVGANRKQLTRQAREAIARRLPQGAIQRKSASGNRPSSIGLGMLLRPLRSMGMPLLALFIGGALLYAAVPRYRFAPAVRFEGSTWYNPYATALHPSARWFRMNLHAHSRAWGGATNGAESPARVAQRYRALGYDIVGISNYHSVAASVVPGVFPVYEHGWNVRKSHHLVLGTRNVEWFDLPFGGDADAQQYLVDRLRAEGSLVALVHPALRAARQAATLEQIGGYDLLEILNHFMPPADSLWDAVLTAGRPVWLLAGDDSHDARKPGETGSNFTWVLSGDTAVPSVIEALARGASTGVRVTGTGAPPQLLSLMVSGDSVTAHFSGEVHAVRAIGDSGHVLARITVGGDSSLRDVTVALPRTSSYLRLVASGTGGVLYTNPVVRWNGTELPRVAGTIDGPATARRRGAWALTVAWGLASLAVRPVGARASRRRVRRPAFARV